MYGPETVRNQFSYLRNNVLMHIHVKSSMCSLKIALKVSKREFIAIFVLSIVLRELLDSVIGKVNILVVNVLWVIFLTACTDVGIFVEKTEHATIDRRKNAVTAKVEFSPMYQQGIVNVSLNDESLFFIRWAGSKYELPDLVQI